MDIKRTSYNLQIQPRKRLLWGLGAIVLIGSIAAAAFIPSQLPSRQLPASINTEPAPPTEPKSAEAKASYTVPPEHPRQLIIAKISVDANVHPVGIAPDGTIGAPTNAWDVGWYTKSALPGKPGSLLLDGHVNDTINSPGVFAKLFTLQQGDEIIIEKGNKATLTYRVTNVAQISLKDVSMKDLLAGPESREQLVLITCGGKYSKESQTYSDRVIVQAQRST